MKFSASIRHAVIVLSAAVACGCSSTGDLSTAALIDGAPAAKPDPACVALANQISSLRSDGAIERLEKASDGKTKNVQVKRESLLKQAELNKANQDFQTRCGPKLLNTQVAPPVAPLPPVATSQAAAKPAAKAAAN